MSDFTKVLNYETTTLLVAVLTLTVSALVMEFSVKNDLVNMDIPENVMRQNMVPVNDSENPTDDLGYALISFSLLPFLLLVLGYMFPKVDYGKLDMIKLVMLFTGLVMGSLLSAFVSPDKKISDGEVLMGKK